MKVSLPLSLKVTLWLLLNLLLLGVAAGVFLVSQAGLSWDSLVAGRSGDRLQALATVVAGEVTAAPAANRNAVLARFSTAYHADFALFRGRGTQLAGPALDLPAAVRQRLDQGPPPGRGLGPPFARGADGASAAEAKPAHLPPAGHFPGRAENRPRFLVHAGAPAAWWIGLRVPVHDGGGRPGPSTLVIVTHSFWAVVLLLNLETWLVVAATVLVLSVLFWLPLVRSVSRDLRTVTLATGQIAEGRFDTRVPVRRRDEIGRLGESVNVMAGRLDTLVNGQKRFLADVAHELGSPLARLQVATEILDRQAGAPLREPLDDVRTEVEQLATLVNELLLFTRSSLHSRALVPLAIEPLIAQVLTREDKQHRVTVRTDPGLAVRADGPLLERAIANLVRNALRYATDGRIELSAIADDFGVVLTVEDEGPGVPDSALARLGEPFYRPESARTRETGGVGLGLAIVRASVGACSGEVRFSNRTPQGFRAEIRLHRAAGPVAPEASS